jgi:hypothetical protein
MITTPFFDAAFKEAIVNVAATVAGLSALGAGVRHISAPKSPDNQ